MGKKLIFRFEKMALNPFFMGVIVLYSGKLVACARLVFPGTNPFSANFIPGRYPVIFSVAYEQNKDTYMVAYSMLPLSEQIPIKWKLSTRSDEDLNLLTEGKKFGFGVDSRTACFMDADVAEIIVDTGWEAKIID